MKYLLNTICFALVASFMFVSINILCALLAVGSANLLIIIGLSEQLSAIIGLFIGLVGLIVSTKIVIDSEVLENWF